MELHFFISGVKPAIIMPRRTFEKSSSDLAGKLFIASSPNDVMVFDSPERYAEFIANGGLRSKEAIGLALGYPPKACKAFTEFARLNDTHGGQEVVKAKRVFVHWLFLMFATSIDHYQEDIEWCEARYAHLLPPHLRNVKAKIDFKDTRAVVSC